MKKKFVLPSFIALTSMSLVGTIAGSLAWLSDKADVKTNSKVGGSSEGAYFAYGDGSAADDPSTPVKEGPYGIETPRQLYNLAWLQYLGYFNKPKGGTIEPKYFELNADIDMSGWAIPPIGTTKYPFIGQFSGKAITGYDQQGNPIYSEPHTITNLQTTNDYAQIVATNKLPGRIKEAESISDVNIVGMFGVVGELADNITAAYDSSVTAIKNFTLKKATIKSTAANTLAGIVAGYVNGPISGVVVDGENITNKEYASKLDLSTGTANYSFNDGKGHSKAFSNISEYGLVGYAESGYLENVHTETTDVYNAVQREYDYIAQDPDEDPGWGGSIPMDEVFGRLTTYRDAAKNAGQPNYPTRRTIQKNEAGQITSDKYSNYTTTTSYLNNIENTSYYSKPTSNNYTYHNYQLKNANNEITSSFAISWYSNSNFVCLNGEKDAWIKNACTTTTHYYDKHSYNGYKISFLDNGTPHYIKAKNTTQVEDTTSSSDATVWCYENKRFYTEINNTYYYLSNSNGSLSLNTTGNTSWEIDGNSIYTYSGGTTGYQLNYQNNAWNAKSFTVSYCLITDGNGNYLKFRRNNTPSNSTNKNDKTTHWLPYNNSFRYNYNGTYYYIRSDRGWFSGDRLYIGSDDSNLYTYDGTTLSYDGYSVYYNNGWDVTRGSSTIIILPAFDNHNSFTLTEAEHIWYVPNESPTIEDSPMHLNPTFFPLKEQNGVPEDTNTGYVVSGGNYKVDQMGDIRFGRFAKNTYLPKKLDTIYTIQSTGNNNSILIADSSIYTDAARKKVFDKSKQNMQAVLDKGNNIDGLHFVDAPMDPDKTVIVPRAVINKQSFENYEMPQDCIDFNLKEKGSINFFAGSYFYNATSGKNNSFFTVHEIRRDSDPDNPSNPYPIHSIDEIVAIYSDGKDAHSYVYEYKNADDDDRKFSKPFMFKTVGQQSIKFELDGETRYKDYDRELSLHEGYNTTPIFKSEWIGINNLKVTGSGTSMSGFAYYFDIGMNDGEYALGSVPNGGVGAYLMYLDIGANARQMFRSEIIEYFKMVDDLYIHPKGITLTVISAGLSSNDKNAYCICIKTSYTGTLTMEKVVNGDVEEGRYVGTGSADQETVSYKIPSDVVKDENGTKMTCTPSSSTTTEIKRMTFYDYDTINSSLNKIVIEDTYVNGSRTSRVVKKYKNWDISNNTGTEDAEMDLYIVTGSGSSQVSHNYKDKTDQITFSTSSNTITLMVFTVVFPDGGVVKVTFTLSVTSRQEAEHYWYSPSTYDVTVTLTKDTGVTEDITALVYITKVVNSDGTYTYTLKFNGQTATITTTPIEITTGS